MGKMIRLWLRITESDHRQLGIIAQAMGGISLSATIRFLIRQWFERNTSHNDTQVAREGKGL